MDARGSVHDRSGDSGWTRNGLARSDFVVGEPWLVRGAGRHAWHIGRPVPFPVETKTQVRGKTRTPLGSFDHLREAFAAKSGGFDRPVVAHPLDASPVTQPLPLACAICSFATIERTSPQQVIRPSGFRYDR